MIDDQTRKDAAELLRLIYADQTEDIVDAITDRVVSVLEQTEREEEAELVASAERMLAKADEKLRAGTNLRIREDSPSVFSIADGGSTPARPSVEIKAWRPPTTRPLGPPLSSLQSKLFAVWHMMHEGLLCEANATEALRVIVEETMKDVDMPLHCRACQRELGHVLRVKGTTVIEVLCPGCVREGRR